jgi:YHS domain-containing protein
MKKGSRVLRLSLLVAVVALVSWALPGVAGAGELERVDAKRVCMVNDTVFPRDQIPVEVGGKTYFGCCEMCKGRIEKDASIRTATDPITGKSVDKAVAVIGAAPDGHVEYFESEESFARYSNKS